MAGSSTEGSAARRVVERALLPTRNLLEEVGDMTILLIGMFGTQVFWGTNPRAPVGG